MAVQAVFRPVISLIASMPSSALSPRAFATFSTPAGSSAIISYFITVVERIFAKAAIVCRETSLRLI